MGKFDFPVLRYGFVAKTSKSLDVDMAEKVSDNNYKYFKSDSFIRNLSKYLKDESEFDLKSELEIIKVPNKKLWEGWVSTSPVLKLGIFHDRKNEIFSEITFRTSIVACLEPNRSKVWVSIFIKRYCNNDAVNITREKADDLFSFYENFAVKLANFSIAIYQDSWGKIGKKVDLKQIGRVLIKTLSYSDKYFTELTGRIINNEEISIPNEIGSNPASSLLNDFFKFIFDPTVSIDSVDAYREVIIAKQQKYEKQLAERDSKSNIEDESEGVQWFGLQYDDTVALFFQEDSGKNSLDMDFFGVATSSKKGKEEKEKSSNKASKAILESVSPFI